MSPRIVIASHLEHSARTLEGYLTSAGYKIFIARDAQAALVIALEVQPALLLIEHDLPYMDGIQITKVIRGEKRLASIPIMIISRTPSTEEIETSLNSGADGHVTAPYNQRVLLAQIQAIFRRVNKTSLSA